MISVFIFFAIIFFVLATFCFLKWQNELENVNCFKFQINNLEKILQEQIEHAKNLVIKYENQLKQEKEMSNPFKAGDIVICIDSEGHDFITKGKKYKVEKPYNEDAVILKGSEVSWRGSRFKLAVDVQFKIGDEIYFLNIKKTQTTDDEKRSLLIEVVENKGQVIAADSENVSVKAMISNKDGIEFSDIIVVPAKYCFANIVDLKVYCDKLLS